MRTRYTLAVVLATLAASSASGCFPDRSLENPYAADSDEPKPAGRGADGGAADGGAGMGGAGDGGEPPAGTGGAGDGGEPPAGMGGAGDGGQPPAGMGGAGQGAGMDGAAGAAGATEGGKSGAGMGNAANGGSSAAGAGGAGASGSSGAGVSGAGASGSSGAGAGGAGASGSSGAGAGGAGASGSSGAGVSGAGSGGRAGSGGQAPPCHEFIRVASILLSEVPPSGAWQASSETRDDHGVVPHFLCIGSRGPGKAVFGYGAGCYMPSDASTLKEVSELQILTSTSPACLNWQAHSSGQPPPNEAFKHEGTSVCRAFAQNIQTESPGVRSTGTHVGQVRASADRYVCVYELYGQLRSAENYELLIERK